MILLDTHAWIWFSGDDRYLSLAALDAVRRADRIGVSPISIWEVSSVAASDNAVATMRRSAGSPWIGRVPARIAIEGVMGTTSTRATASARATHRSTSSSSTSRPFEQSIVTKDEKIHQSALLTPVW